MRTQFKTALALLFVASLPLTLRAAPQTSSGEPLTASQVKQAEATAKTSADHVRLAVFYESKARQVQSKLADADDQVKHYSWMAGRTKVPNAYTSSKSLADQYRAEFEQNTKLAADHRRMAESLGTRASAN